MASIWGRLGVLGKCPLFFKFQAPPIPEASVTSKAFPGVRLSQRRTAPTAPQLPGSQSRLLTRSAGAVGAPDGNVGPLRPGCSLPVCRAGETPVRGSPRPCPPPPPRPPAQAPRPLLT